MSFKNILFPVDFSDYSLEALPYVRELARAFDAQVHCLYVVEDAMQFWTAMGPEAIPVGPLPDEIARLAEGRMARFRSEHLGGFAHEPITSVTVGSSFVEIISYSREHKIDLIVMTTHGRGAIAHALLGGTAEKVVRKAPCAVLTVRVARHKFEPP